MAVNESFLEFVREKLSELEGLNIRKMFGGAGVFMDGKMFGIIHEASFFLKADEDLGRDFMEMGMDRFQPYKDRKMKMPYFEVPEEILEDNEELASWARRSIEIASR